MNVTLKQMRAFLAVTQFGSFTRAARILHVSQPALTVQIRDFETELGVALFERTTRSVRLSRVGRELAQDIQSVVRDLDAVLKRAADLASRPVEQLTLACIPSLAGTILPEVIAAFARTHPDVDVVVRDLGWKGVLAAVRGGEASIGIGASEVTEAEIVTTALMDDQIHVVAPCDHPLTRQDEITLADVSRHQLVLTSFSSSLRNTIEYQFQKLGLLGLVKHDVAQFSSAIGLVRAHMGITMLPGTASELSDCAGLFTHPIANCTRKIVLLTSARRPRTDAATTFERLLREAFARAAPARPGG